LLPCAIAATFHKSPFATNKHVRESPPLRTVHHLHAQQSSMHASVRATHFNTCIPSSHAVPLSVCAPRSCMSLPLMVCVRHFRFRRRATQFGCLRQRQDTHTGTVNSECARAEACSAHFSSPSSTSLWFTQRQCDITLPSSYCPTEFTQSTLLTCKKKRSQTGPYPDTSLVPSLCPPSTAKRLVTTATFTEHGCRAHGSLDRRPDHGDPVAYWIRDFALDTSGPARSTAIATAAA